MRRSSRTQARRRASVKPSPRARGAAPPHPGTAADLLEPRVDGALRRRAAARSAAPRAGSTRDRPAVRWPSRSDRRARPTSTSPSASAARASLSVIGWPPTMASVRSISSDRSGRLAAAEPRTASSDQNRRSMSRHQNACPSEMCSTFERSRPPVSSSRGSASSPSRRAAARSAIDSGTPKPLVDAQLVEANVAARA